VAKRAQHRHSTCFAAILQNMLEVLYCPFQYRSLKYLRIFVLVKNVQSWKNKKVVKSQLGKETTIKQTCEG